eukprot:SAG31_NODE_6587_length_1962_cov_1.245303_2_plen_196_part_00
MFRRVDCIAKRRQKYSQATARHFHCFCKAGSNRLLPSLASKVESSAKRAPLDSGVPVPTCSRTGGRSAIATTRPTSQSINRKILPIPESSHGSVVGTGAATSYGCESQPCADALPLSLLLDEHSLHGRADSPEPSLSPEASCISETGEIPAACKLRRCICSCVQSLRPRSYPKPRLSRLPCCRLMSKSACSSRKR